MGLDSYINRQVKREGKAGQPTPATIMTAIGFVIIIALTVGARLIF